MAEHQTIAEEVAPVIENKVRVVSHEVLDLKLRALRSDLRLMILASVALNQFLANVSLPREVTAAAIAAAILAPAAKSLFTLVGRS